MTEGAVVMSCYGVSRWFDYVFIKRYLLSECENVRRVGDRGIVHVIPALTPVPARRQLSQSHPVQSHISLNTLI